MKPEDEALGRRAVACKRWRWMPGMLVPGWRLEDGEENGATEGPPDFSDPATLGCLLALVREAWPLGMAAYSRQDHTGAWICVHYRTPVVYSVGGRAMSISVPRSRKQTRGSKLRLDAVELRSAVVGLLAEQPDLSPPIDREAALRALAPRRPRGLTIDGLAALMSAAEAREERSTVATLALAGGVPEQIVAELLELALASLLVRQVGETWEIARRGRLQSPWSLSSARLKATRASA